MATAEETNSGEPRDDERVSSGRMHLAALGVLTLVAVYFCYRLTEPFLPALAWAVALAVIAWPAHRWISGLVGSPNWSAGLSVTLVTLVLVVPGLYVVGQLMAEAGAAGEKLEEHAGDGRWKNALAGVPFVRDAIPWLDQHFDPERTVRGLLQPVTADVAALLKGSAWAALEALVMLFALFFCFRDRGRLLQGLRGFMPLTSRETNYLFARVDDSIHATVYGTLVAGILQGVTGGLLFWALGLPSPVLWGFVMTVLSVLPIVGAFLVWAPAAALLLAEQRWGAALALTAWGVAMAGPICNFVYGHCAGDRMRLHPIPALIAFVGGLAVFGIAGMVLGPALLAVTVGLIEVWRGRAVRDETSEDEPLLVTANGEPARR